jgi:hypothetical protein
MEKLKDPKNQTDCNEIELNPLKDRAIHEGDKLLF